MSSFAEKEADGDGDDDRERLSSNSITLPDISSTTCYETRRSEGRGASLAQGREAARGHETESRSERVPYKWPRCLQIYV